MANYYTQIVVQPEIPAHLLDEQTRKRLEDCWLTCAYDDRADTYYLYSEMYVGSDEDDVHYDDILQEVVANADRRSDHDVQQATAQRLWWLRDGDYRRGDQIDGHIDVVAPDPSRNVRLLTAYLSEVLLFFAKAHKGLPC